ncbi:MAG: hypothetical protein AABX05_04200 [Nanoarchaeota archaeon]
MNLDAVGSSNGNNLAFKVSLNTELKKRFDSLIPLSRHILILIGSDFLDFNSKKEEIKDNLDKYIKELVNLDLWLGQKSLQLIDRKEQMGKLLVMKKKRDSFHNHIKEVQEIKILLPITKEKYYEGFRKNAIAVLGRIDSLLKN